jgi:hypothetical protein
VQVAGRILVKIGRQPALQQLDEQRLEHVFGVLTVARTP